MWDEVTKEAVGVFPAAFELRPGEKDLSVNWMEFFPGDRKERLRQVVKHAELKLRPNHGYGIIQVGDVHDTCANQGAKVRIIHEPTTGNPGHAAVHQYPVDNASLMAVLANLAGRDLTLVRDIGNSED
jgi:hypothetical protein